jgi:hypothetical protein
MKLALALEPFGEDDEGNRLTGYQFRPMEDTRD